MYRVFLNLAASAAFLCLSSVSSKAVEVYMFKGAGDFSFVNENMHFSRGLNKMSEILNSEGIRSEVRRFGQIEDALATIRSRKPKSVAFVGHSMGALASMAIARNLKDEGVEIAYMALIDIPGPAGVAGENVDWVENYFSINPVYARLTNTKSHPNAKNIHVAGYIHNRMDDAPKVQNGILAAIREVHAAEQEKDLAPSKPAVYVSTEPTAPDAHAPATASFAPASNFQISTASTPAATAHTSSSYEPNSAMPPSNLQFDPSLSVTYVDSNGNQHPYPLPSVRPPEYVGAEGQASQSTQPIQNEDVVDRMTTSGIEQPGIIDRGKDLLRKAGNYLHRPDSTGKPSRIPLHSDR